MRRSKAAILRLIDTLKVRLLLTRIVFDKMKYDYQPIPWLGIDKANIRGDASIDRWNKIRPLISNNSSMKDLGCCVGYFCHSVTELNGMRTFGYDLNSDFITIANYTKTYVANGENEVFINMALTPETVQYVSATEVTLLLSVWHHWVYHYGLADASTMLKKVWALTEDTLFFESGEEEVADEFKLPFSCGASDWLEDYLNEQLVDAQISRLGQFSAGNYAHYSMKDKKRTLFMVKRL